MTESFVYGLLAMGIMLAINKFVVTMFLKLRNAGVGLMYGSMATKLLFLSVLTLIIKYKFQ
jgi:hypothetical protein